jgi:hypothetical protein
MPTQTKLVDLGREVSVGTNIEVDGAWWKVERVAPPGVRAGHRGRLTAPATTLSKCRKRYTHCASDDNDGGEAAA